MKLIETKDNNFTININGIFVHSKYSPIKEAERFVINSIKNPKTVIIIGAGLGYIFTYLKENHPKIEVISLPLNKQLGELSLSLNNTTRQQWNTEENLNTFINKHIGIHNIYGIEILQWGPTTALYPDLFNEINNSIVSRIRRVNGHILTTARFGRLWIKNSIKNYLKIENYLSNFFIDKPIFIVASGKSLEDSYSFLRKVRSQIFIISLSSANLALKENNITPDLTFSTDPSYYSKLHIYNHRGVICMPFTNSTNSGNTILLLNQNNFFENEIINIGNLPNIKINENGTVAGTALDFALNYSSENIFLIGQDLEPRDINCHISPYSFDNLLKSQENRVNPHYSIMYKRFINQGVSYSTYRDWFSEISTKYPNRIFRVNKSAKKITGIPDVNHSFISNILPNKFSNIEQQLTIHKSDPREIKMKQINLLLKKWMESIDKKEISENPLIYLISTAKYTDIYNKALSNTEFDLKIKEIKSESKQFVKRLLQLYGSKFL